MERVIEVDEGIARERAPLRRGATARCGRVRRGPRGVRAPLARRREAARFDELNELIRQHNDWYPIERDLPMDLRTRDYVKVNGRSYRRPELGPRMGARAVPGP